MDRRFFCVHPSNGPVVVWPDLLPDNLGDIYVHCRLGGRCNLSLECLHVPLHGVVSPAKPSAKAEHDQPKSCPAGAELGKFFAEPEPRLLEFCLHPPIMPIPYPPSSNDHKPHFIAQHPTLQKNDLTTNDKIARRKLSLLELANEMSNVSKARRIMGYYRQQIYEIRRNYQTYEADGLIDRLPGARGPHPNRVSEEVEAAIHVMNNDVLPTSEGHEARISTVLSYNGRECYGRSARHPFELFLQLKEIEHRTTRSGRRNQTDSSSGCTERFSTSTSVS